MAIFSSSFSLIFFASNPSILLPSKQIKGERRRKEKKRRINLEKTILPLSHQWPESLHKLNKRLKTKFRFIWTLVDLRQNGFQSRVYSHLHLSDCRKQYIGTTWTVKPRETQSVSLGVLSYFCSKLYSPSLPDFRTTCQPSVSSEYLLGVRTHHRGLSDQH